MGKKKKITKNIYPGYIMIRLNKSYEVYQYIKNTEYVINVMSKAISQKELNIIINNTKNRKKIKKIPLSYEVMDNIKITNGPFENFSGCIDKIDNNNKKIKVTLNIFGRDTPVILGFSQIEKVE